MGVVIVIVLAGIVAAASVAFKGPNNPIEEVAIEIIEDELHIPHTNGQCAHQSESKH